MPDMPSHIYEGMCPDKDKPQQTDPDCPACRVMQQCSSKELGVRLMDLGAEMVYVSMLLEKHGGYELDALNMEVFGKAYDDIGMELLKNA